MDETGQRAKSLLAAGRFGALAVTDFESGGPYVALANYACDAEGLPIFLFSSLARHMKGIARDKRASLLVAEIPAEGDALAGTRATFIGVLEAADQVSGAAYVARHPYAAGYATFADFSFWRLRVNTVHIVGGFGRIETLSWP